MGTYLGSRSCTTSTPASATVNSSEVFSSPTPSVSLIQSAKLSPTVVHNTLMIQNQTTTSGTLLSNGRVAGSARVVVGAVIRPILPNRVHRRGCRQSADGKSISRHSAGPEAAAL